MFAGLALFSVLVLITKASEPQCSPFHFVEQTLTKVIQVEMLVRKMKEDIEMTQQKVKEDIATTQQKVLEKLKELDINKRQLKSDLDNELENMKMEYNEMEEANKAKMDEFTAEFEKIKDQGRKPVLFLAQKVTDVTPSTGQRLVFKITMMNEGNGYDNTSGIFTAPVGGVYLFTIQLCLPSSTAPYYSIVAENNSIKQGYFYDNENGSCHTADAITTLKPGGTVWITTPYGGKLQQSSSYWNTFSGVLLHSTV